MRRQKFWPSFLKQRNPLKIEIESQSQIKEKSKENYCSLKAAAQKTAKLARERQNEITNKACISDVCDHVTASKLSNYPHNPAKDDCDAWCFAEMLITECEGAIQLYEQSCASASPDMGDDENQFI